jgi:hypothetical protein
MSARMLKQERVEAPRQFLKEQKDRAHIEAQIAELEKQPGVSDAQLEELGLTVWPLSPAMEFMRKRLNEVSPDDFDSGWKQAIVDLVESDIPLDRHTRSKIAAELRRLYFPNSVRDRREKRQLESAMIEDQKRYLLSTGMTAAEADQIIAKERGIKVAALRKRDYRTKT